MKCEIIRDLMPLYLDECCSEGSRKLVEEHIRECKACQELLEQMRKELVVGAEEKCTNLNEEELLLTGKEVIRTEMWEKCLINVVWMDIPLNILLIIFGIWTLSHWNYVNMIQPYDQMLRLSRGPELFFNMYGSVGTPYMLGIAIYGLVGNIKYLGSARKKCQTAILTSVTIQSVLFKSIMLVVYALVGFLLLLD